MEEQSTALAVVNEIPPDMDQIRYQILKGNVASLTTPQRETYTRFLCQRFGLEPVGNPFQFIPVGEKVGNGPKAEILYATANCTAQLARNLGLSVEIVSREFLEHPLKPGMVLCVTTARVTAPGGSYVEDVGAVSICKEDGTWANNRFTGNGTYIPLNEVAFANAVKKSATQATRRAILAKGALKGFVPDESEVEDIVTVNAATGQIVGGRETLAEKKQRELERAASGDALERIYTGIKQHAAKHPRAFTPDEKRALAATYEQRREQLAAQAAQRLTYQATVGAGGDVVDTGKTYPTSIDGHFVEDGEPEQLTLGE